MNLFADFQLFGIAIHVLLQVAESVPQFSEFIVGGYRHNPGVCTAVLYIAGIARKQFQGLRYLPGDDKRHDNQQQHRKAANDQKQPVKLIGRNQYFIVGTNDAQPPVQISDRSIE